MEKDSMNSSHPLSTPVETFEQIEEMFDSISYEKVCKSISEEIVHKLYGYMVISCRYVSR